MKVVGSYGIADEGWLVFAQQRPSFKKAATMRKVVFATLALMSLSSLAEAASFQPPLMSQPAQSDVIEVQNFNSQADSSNRNNGYDRRKQRFVCVVTPPDSANRSRPYVCPVQQGRVGGRCRCNGVVGNGNIDTAW
jgi:hypothetical protein